ncbi:prevent-host-death protein [Streptomyces sp. NPDC002845]
MARRALASSRLITTSHRLLDAVQSGQAFTVTRDGHQIGELVPLRRRRRFVSRSGPDISLDAFRADQDATAEQEADDPYAR